MPLYEYRGLTTGTVYNIVHSIHDDALKEYNNEPVQRLISRCNIIIDNNKPKTIDELARKNTEEMKKRGDKRIKPKKKRPFWREKDKVDTSLAKMPAEQTRRYIMEGKK